MKLLAIGLFVFLAMLASPGVANAEAPTITITSPVEGQVVERNAWVTITVDVVVEPTSLWHIRYRVDGKEVCSTYETTCVYRNRSKPGPVTIRATVISNEYGTGWDEVQVVSVR